jgi:hypothetical protein
LKWVFGFVKWVWFGFLGVGGFSYLLEPLWWLGMITSKLAFSLLTTSLLVSGKLYVFLVRGLQIVMILLSYSLEMNRCFVFVFNKLVVSCDSFDVIVKFNDS